MPTSAAPRGVVKSLALASTGPVGLLHTQKVEIKYKKPVRYDWQKRIFRDEQIGVTTLQIQLTI